MAASSSCSRADRAIDDDAWATLYSTVGRPFDAPSTGTIAVKTINRSGDEVLKVHECRPAKQA